VIHEGRDENGQDHSPHAHLMFSERQNDGIERGPAEWFRRANSEDPEHGGAPKNRTFHGRDWVEQARERWADLTNKKLEERLGPSESIIAVMNARASTGNPRATALPPESATAVDVPWLINRCGAPERDRYGLRGGRVRAPLPS